MCVTLKLKFSQYSSIHTNYIKPHCTTLQYNHNIWHGTYAEANLQTRKILNSTALPSRYFGTHRQCFSAARLTWLGYGAGRKRENCSVWKYRIIVASTCRRSVQFGCYITWLWMANCVSVMIKTLPLFNFTISSHGRRAWKTSRCACALDGSRVRLVESTLFGDHVSLRFHRKFCLKFNLSN